MNTVHYNLETGVIVGFITGETQPAQEGHGVLYTPKFLSELLGCVVLDSELISRMSLVYALSEKSSSVDKILFWKEYRNNLLADSDFMLLPDVGDAAFQKRAIEYRQKLRDLTRHENWPNLLLEDLPQKPNAKSVQLTVL